MSKLGNKTTKGVRSLSRGTKVLNMLDLIVSKPRPIRLGEICKGLGIERATAYQQLKTLTDSNWLEIRMDGGYQLSNHAINERIIIKEKYEVKKFSCCVCRFT